MLALAEIFPRGLLKKTLAEYKTEATRMCLLTYSASHVPERMRRIGLKGGDCIFGIDGFDVETQEQLDTVLGFTDDPLMTIIVSRRYPERK